MSDPLAVIGALAACHDLISLIVRTVKSYARADDDIANLVDKLEDDVILLNQYLDFFRIHKEYFRSKNEDGHLDRIVDNLRARLEKTARKIQKLDIANPLDRMRWVIIKSDVAAVEAEICQWSQRFSARLAPLPDSMKQELVNSVNRENFAVNKAPISGFVASLKMKQLAAAAARSDETSLLRLEKSELVHLSQTAQIQQYHVDFLHVPASAQLKEIKLEVAKLVDTLRGAGPSQIHILEAYGFFERDERDRPFGIAYNLPDGLREVTNLHNLLEHQPGHPLEARLQCAVSITTAVAYLHAMSFVHKSIRSSNILLVYSAPPPAGLTTGSSASLPDTPALLQTTEAPQIGTPYLVGFSYARRGTARSTGSSRADWRNEIYRHPERQGAELGIDPEVYYKAYHDVYSLGVVLLELGLWERLDAKSHEKLKRASPKERKIYLIGLANNHLPLKIGSKYAGIVKECLEVDRVREGTEEQMTVQRVLEELEELRF